MTAQTQDTAEVRTSIEVAAPPERAFRVFTADLDRWWPRSHHLLPGELAENGVDPFAGGRVWERSTDGETCTWGRVLTWNPPTTFAFTWLIGPDFDVPGPDAEGSRVTVTFTPVEGGTRVELVHDRLDAHGARWRDLRSAVASDGGWPQLLGEYAAAV
jgi:uncharacterized protein YndB with AHSA1/START domain